LIKICIFAIKIKKIGWVVVTDVVVEDVVVVSSSRISLFNVVVADVVVEDVVVSSSSSRIPLLIVGLLAGVYIFNRKKKMP